MSEMTQGDYWREVASIAETVAEESHADGLDRDDLDERLWETIDGHQWVIYTAYNFDILRHSPNDDYYGTNFGAEGIATDAGMNWSALAFGALYADVQERLEVEDCDCNKDNQCELCNGLGWYPAKRVAA